MAIGAFDPDDVMPWQYLDKPYYWPALGKHVIADRHLPDGTRQHMVEGHVEPVVVINNAQVIGQDDLLRK